MSDSDLREAAGALERDVQRVIDAGQPLLSGTANVELFVPVHEAETPQQAVAAALESFIRHGMARFTFAVTDSDSGETYYVRDGELVDLTATEEQDASDTSSS